MPLKLYLLVLSAMFCISASVSASAQTVYKCGARRSPTYTEKPCSRRIVNTSEAPVPVKPNPGELDVRRIEQNQAAAQAMRPRAGESATQFETRRRRARMMAEDRAECERLDTACRWRRKA